MRVSGRVTEWQSGRVTEWKYLGWKCVFRKDLECKTGSWEWPFMVRAGWRVRILRAWLKNPRVRIVSVSSRRKESAEKLARKYELDCTIHDSYDNVLADSAVDIVNISGPNDVHAPQGIAAAEAGKHILIEKPMVMSLEENIALRDAVAKAGVKSVVSFVLRWVSLFDNVKSLIKAGSIGELFYIEADYWHGLGDYWTGWDWAKTKEQGGSTMLLGGCHAVDILRWISEDEVVEVSAMSNNKTGRMAFDANVVAILKFESGMIGKTSALFDLQIPYSLNVDVAGTTGDDPRQQTLVDVAVAGANRLGGVPLGHARLR